MATGADAAGAETLSAWLARHAADAHRIALRLGSKDLRYDELSERVGRLASALLGHGIGRGDVVALQLPNSIEFLLSYLAVSSIGGITQTLHLPYRAAELEPLLRHSRARAVIAPRSIKEYPTAEVLLELAHKLDTLTHVIITDATLPGCLALETLAAGGGPVPSAAPLLASDPFVLLYTSGTTASPKGVRASYQQFLRNAQLTANELGVTERDCILSAAPFTHLYGLFTVHLALSVGARMALLPVFQPRDLVETIARDRVTAVFAAPAHVQACLEAEDAHLASLRFVGVSGTRCAPELARRLDAKLPNGKVLQMWGMTELQLGSFTRLGDPLEVRATSVGRPSPGTTIRVADASGQAVTAGTEGEIEVRGVSVFSGYFDNPEATGAAFTADGWFRTGDLGTVDASGALRLTGRSKDVINRGGVKFNPADVETAVAQHPAVQQAAIVPMPDPLLGERACCFAVLKSGVQITLEELCAFLGQQHIAKNRWPERLEVIDAMPLTPTGKVIKDRLKARLGDGTTN